jgi:hypothetical protein
MIVKETTAQEFYKLGFKSWIELHWTVANSLQEATRILKDKRLDVSDDITIYLTPLGYMYPRQ